MQRHEVYILDIIDSCKLALEYISEIKEEEFYQDTKCQDSVVRRLEIIGEAARRIPENKRILSPHLPWQKMIQMRNIMIHEYDDIDFSIVWNTLKNDLPQLLAELEQTLSNGEHN